MSGPFAGCVDKWGAVAADLAGLPAGSRVLECGSGTGLYTLTMLRHGLRVTAVDLVETSLHAARAQRLLPVLETLAAQLRPVPGAREGRRVEVGG